MKINEYQCKGYSVALTKGHSDYFSQKLFETFEIKFDRKANRSTCLNTHADELDTCQRWLAYPYIVKIFQHFLLQSQWTDVLETLYIALGTKILLRLLE